MQPSSFLPGLVFLERTNLANTSAVPLLTPKLVYSELDCTSYTVLARDS